MRILHASLPCLLIVTAFGASRAAGQGTASPPAAAASSEYGSYTRADVRFMSGMIGHHAQAVTMAGWAESHGAGATLRTLARRIIVGQSSEIELMQNWLRDRKEVVPDPLAKHDMAGMSMPGMNMASMPGMAGHDSLMPGMLTAEQMAQLDKARGVEFDRTFLNFMIQHHRGALVMVDTLFHSEGAAQDDTVFRFATGVNADQSVEIERMYDMLDKLPAPKKGKP